MFPFTFTLKQIPPTPKIEIKFNLPFLSFQIDIIRGRNSGLDAGELLLVSTFLSYDVASVITAVLW